MFTEEDYKAIAAIKFASKYEEVVKVNYFKAKVPNSEPERSVVIEVHDKGIYADLRFEVFVEGQMGYGHRLSHALDVINWDKF